MSLSVKNFLNGKLLSCANFGEVGEAKYEVKFLYRERKEESWLVGDLILCPATIN